MEDIIKFLFYAVIFVIYIVSQLRKAKKKQEEERANQDPVPMPVPPVRKMVSMDSSERLQEDKQLRKLRESKPSLLKRKTSVAEKEEKRVEYKSLEEDFSEQEQVSLTLLERRQEEERMSRDRPPLAEEHFNPYAQRGQSTTDTLSWIRTKSNLKKAFIASEVFAKKY
jgi:hypothetical protein